MCDRSLSLCAAFCYAAFCAAQAPVIEWQKTFGGSDYDNARSFAPTSDGGFVVAGSTRSADGDVTNNHGGDDCWVVKLDPGGDPQWQRTLGGSSSEYASSIVPTSDGGYVLAAYTPSTDGDVTNSHGGGEYWVVKLDPGGSLQWQRTLGGSSSEYPSALAPTSDGGYVVAGYTYSTDGDVTNNHGNSDYWVVKLDTSGNLQWQRTLGGSDYDQAYSIVPASDGGYVVAGYTFSTDGDVTNYHGTGDVWVVKLDPGGNLQWQKTLGGSDTDYNSAIAPTTDGGYVVSGYTRSTDGDVTNSHGNSDAWVVKLDPIGNLQWQRTLGGSGFESASSIAPTSDGGYAVAGYTTSTDGDVTNNRGNEDYWVVKLDPSGNLQWQRTLGGSADDMARSIVTTSNGGYVVSGSVLSRNGDVTNHHGNDDYWVVKLTPDFNTISGQVFADLNSNGIYDAGDVPLPNHAVHSIDNAAVTWTNASAQYDLVVLDSGNVSVEPSTLPYYTAVPATQTAYFNGFQQTDSLNDLALQPTGVFNDLTVSIAPATAFRPGLPAQYVIQYRNVGTTALVPSVVLHNDLQLLFDSASVAPTSVASDAIAWELPVLGPLEQGSLVAYFTVGQGAVLGSTISSTVTIDPLADDATAFDNAATWYVVVTGSFDPNDKAVNRNFIAPDELISPPDLEYIIRFQNTGTDTAFSIRIEDHLSAKLQRNSLEVLGSSHPLQIAYSAYNDLITYQFTNILLPDSNTNGTASHGYVHYRIKPLSTLQLGDSILNQASIFFDLNTPVVTNTVRTMIETSTAIAPVPRSDFISLYPNPAHGSVWVSSPKAVRNATLTLSDALGRELLSATMNGTSQTLVVGDLPRGLYVVTLSSPEGKSVQRVVLE